MAPSPWLGEGTHTALSALTLTPRDPLAHPPNPHCSSCPANEGRGNGMGLLANRVTWTWQAQVVPPQ